MLSTFKKCFLFFFVFGRLWSLCWRPGLQQHWPFLWRLGRELWRRRDRRQHLVSGVWSLSGKIPERKTDCRQGKGSLNVQGATFIFVLSPNTCFKADVHVFTGEAIEEKTSSGENAEGTPHYGGPPGDSGERSFPAVAQQRGRAQHVVPPPSPAPPFPATSQSQGGRIGRTAQQNGMSLPPDTCQVAISSRQDVFRRTETLQ